MSFINFPMNNGWYDFKGIWLLYIMVEVWFALKKTGYKSWGGGAKIEIELNISDVHVRYTILNTFHK